MHELLHQVTDRNKRLGAVGKSCVRLSPVPQNNKPFSFILFFDLHFSFIIKSWTWFDASYQDVQTQKTCRLFQVTVLFRVTFASSVHCKHLYLSHIRWLLNIFILQCPTKAFVWVGSRNYELCFYNN